MALCLHLTSPHLNMLSHVCGSLATRFFPRLALEIMAGAGVKQEQGNPIEELQAYFDTVLSLVMCVCDGTDEMLSYGLSSPPSQKPCVLFQGDCQNQPGAACARCSRWSRSEEAGTLTFLFIVCIVGLIDLYLGIYVDD